MSNAFQDGHPKVSSTFYTSSLQLDAVTRPVTELHKSSWSIEAINFSHISPTLLIHGSGATIHDEANDTILETSQQLSSSHTTTILIGSATAIIGFIAVIVVLVYYWYQRRGNKGKVYLTDHAMQAGIFDDINTRTRSPVLLPEEIQMQSKQLSNRLPVQQAVVVSTDTTTMETSMESTIPTTTHQNYDNSFDCMTSTSPPPYRLPPPYFPDVVIENLHAM